MVNWKLKHTIWGLFSALIIILIGFGVVSFIETESTLIIGSIVLVTIFLAIVPVYTVLFGTNKDELFVRGIPIKSRIKSAIVTILMIILIINNVIIVFSDGLDYPGRNVLSITLIVLMVIFCIGSKIAETMVIALSLFLIINTSYDFSVLDSSDLRKNILVGSFAILGISLTLGKISLLNLLGILKNQMGLGGRIR